VAANQKMADSGGNPTLPSLRELELEQLLREREQQLLDLTVEYTVAFPFYHNVQPFLLTV
jgi:hypothetical protein